MRAEFPGYYPPTEEDYKSLLDEATIVLDTNVLLDLYRLPDQSRSELVETIEKISDQLWIPFQVALEFQRSRLNVIFSERKRTEDVLSSMQRITDELRDKINNLQIEKRDIVIEDGGLLRELEAAHEGIKKKIEAVRAKQTDISSDDPIRDRLDKILNGKVGRPPKDQAELDHLTREGDERYQNKVPPGFQDSEKSKDESKNYYFHDASPLMRPPYHCPDSGQVQKRTTPQVNIDYLGEKRRLVETGVWTHFRPPSRAYKRDNS